MADVDWTRWLPPHPLPDTGKKQFKPGQVWSGRAPGSDDRAAVVGWDDAGHPALLAGGGDGTLTHNYSERGERWSRHAVLVQDAGQSEPTPPDVLFGGCRGSELLPGDIVETTFGRFKLVEFLGQWSLSSGPMMNWRADPVDDLWKAVAGEGREPPTNIAFTSREMLGVTRTLPGEVVMMPVTFIFSSRPPVREVSSNGRDWVEHASLADPDPFEAYEHQRIGGVEQRPARCGESRCQSAGTWRDRRIGGLHKRVFQCDHHFLRSEDIVRSGMADHENLSRSNAARMRMAEMDHNAAGLGGSALAPGAYPKTFGGIWRTR